MRLATAVLFKGLAVLPDGEPTFDIG